MCFTVAGAADDGGGELAFDDFAFGFVPEAVHRVDGRDGEDGLAADEL